MQFPVLLIVFLQVTYFAFFYFPPERPIVTPSAVDRAWVSRGLQTNSAAVNASVARAVPPTTAMLVSGIVTIVVEPSVKIEILTTALFVDVNAQGYFKYFFFSFGSFLFLNVCNTVIIFSLNDF